MTRILPWRRSIIIEPWVWPNQRSVEEVHLNFAGPFQGVRVFGGSGCTLQVWPNVHLVKETTAADVLRLMFSSFGLPEQLVTDNGPQFVVEDIAMFAKANGIKHDISDVHSL